MLFVERGSEAGHLSLTEGLGSRFHQSLGLSLGLSKHEPPVLPCTALQHCWLPLRAVCQGAPGAAHTSTTEGLGCRSHQKLGVLNHEPCVLPCTTLQHCGLSLRAVCQGAPAAGVPSSQLDRWHLCMGKC
jgi:hypothetical protein